MADELAERIEWDFTFHAPTRVNQSERQAAVRTTLRGAAMNLIQATPPGREQSLALTKLEEAMFWANAAIAREDRP